MQRRRGRDALTDLCSGPGKLGVSLGLGPDDHGCPLAFPEGRTMNRRRGFLPRDEGRQFTVTTDVRIGISRAVERPWRFLAGSSPHISHPPRRPSVMR
jgi:DNA-3-methyladenine glycosylase